MQSLLRAAIAIFLVALSACASDDDPLQIILLSGGDATTLNRSAGTFETPAPNLTSNERTKHLAGDATFGALFQPPPATVNAGLGPQFNHDSCASCHVRNGRGSPTADTDAEGSMLLVRVSQPGRDAITGGPLALPVLGDQLQDHAITGHTPEVALSIEWELLENHYVDGEGYQLRRPKLAIALGDGGHLESNVMTSPRIPPPVFGLGLLEAVSEGEILEYSDPNDSNSDGISGRPNYAWNVAERKSSLGRFGWKANTPNLLQQAAGAYAADMGVANSLFLDPDGGLDISDETLTATEFYTQTLAVPIRTTLDDSARRGYRLFSDASCANCHRTTMRTGQHTIPALSNQLIAPYTDLLIHDLGDELADHRPDFEATGSEWRTAPLWGIGLNEMVLGQGAFLHDGRARTLEEAILWHGGEAEASRDSFKRMSKSDRAAIIAFLRAL